MDLDLGIIGAVLHDNEGYLFSKRNGISENLLEGPARAGWVFIDNHVLEYGKVPSIDVFESETNLPALKSEENIEYYVKNIKGRGLWNRLRITYDEVGSLLERRDNMGVIDKFKNVVQGVYNDGLSGIKASSLLSIGDDVIKHYEKMKAGVRGIQTPWKAVNDATLGWWPGDFIIIVARLGIGKTWGMLMFARQAWLDGYKVLFIGTEMARFRLAARFYSLHLGLPYDDFRRGNLSASEEKRMYEEIKNLSSSKGLDIVGDNFDPNMHDIERAVDEINPDLLIVDGMYLIKNKGIDRHSIISNTAFDFKRMAMTRGIPIIASHQFNRTVSAEDRLNIDISNVAVSDVIGWTADVAYGMYQTTEMKGDNVMGWRPMKLREGVSDDHFTNWNFKKMFFDQRARPQVAPRGAENLEYNSIPVDTEWAGSDRGNDQLF